MQHVECGKCGAINILEDDEYVGKLHVSYIGLGGIYATFTCQSCGERSEVTLTTPWWYDGPSH